MREAKTFLDTNIIVYAYDRSAGSKREIAKEIMVDLWNSGKGLLSTQVLQEFFVIATNKIGKPLDRGIAREILYDLLRWDVVVNDGEAILSAIDIQLKYGFSFWDSMIISSAQAGGASLLLSEDITDGQTIAGVTVKNPFLV